MPSNFSHLYIYYCPFASFPHLNSSMFPLHIKVILKHLIWTVVFCRQAISSLDHKKRYILALSSAGIGGLLFYLAWRKKSKRIPVGDGWWRVEEKSLTEDRTIRPFVVESSKEMLEVQVDAEFKEFHYLYTA